MRKILFGFLGGVVLTSLAFILSTASTDGTDKVDIPATGDSAVRSSTLGSGDDLRISQETVDRSSGDDEVAAATIAPTQESLRFPEGDSSREASLRQELEETQRVLADVRAERDYLLRSAAHVDGPVVSPIQLSSEFDWLSENIYRGRFHEQIQREYIDADWASATETRVSDFIYDRPALVQKYGAPTIRCHTTRCEVTFLARGIADDPSVAIDDANTLFRDAIEAMNGLFACGPGECWADANSQNGVVTIYWGMTKNNAVQTQSSSSGVVALR